MHVNPANLAGFFYVGTRACGKESIMIATVTTSTDCPECAGPIQLTDVELGEILVCNDCGVELEIRSLTPLQIALAPEEAEDWGE